MGNSTSLCHSCSHTHAMVRLPLRHCVYSKVHCRKGWGHGLVLGSRSSRESLVVSAWHHQCFCFCPSWAPISLSPPATGEQAFVLRSRAAVVFLLVCLRVHFVCHPVRKQDAVVAIDNTHKVSKIVRPTFWLVFCDISSTVFPYFCTTLHLWKFHI